MGIIFKALMDEIIVNIVARTHDAWGNKLVLTLRV